MMPRSINAVMSSKKTRCGDERNANVVAQLVHKISDVNVVEEGQTGHYMWQSPVIHCCAFCWARLAFIAATAL